MAPATSVSSTNTPTVRPAESGDLPAIIALLADDALGAAREDLSEPAAPCYREAFAALERDPNNMLYVAVSEDEIIGCFQLTIIPGLSRRGALRAQIESVRVSSSRRGQGLGRFLFEWAIEESRRRNCVLVQLTTDKARADAHRFYESLGFVASHEGMKLQLT